MSKGSVLVLGGSSDIGLAVAKRFAREGHPIQLAARQPQELEAEKSDIELRHGVKVTLHPFDALDIKSHENLVDRLPALPDVAVCAVGIMGDQKESERNPAAAILVMRSNYEGPANIIAILANRFEQRRAGTIIGISSVAGERGRRSNYVYGSAKAGLTAFLSGLRNRLANAGVHVMTVLPGFVDTRMTAGMNLPSALIVSPEALAETIYGAYRKKGDVVYSMTIWRLIMLIIKAIPESIFKKMKL
jgi:hypothetical protein